MWKYLILLGFTVASQCGEIHDFINHVFTAHQEPNYNAFKMERRFLSINVDRYYKLLEEVGSTDFNKAYLLVRRLNEVAGVYAEGMWYRYGNEAFSTRYQLIWDMVIGKNLTEARITLQNLVNSFYSNYNIQGVIRTISTISNFGSAASWIICARTFDPRNDGAKRDVSDLRYFLTNSKQNFKNSGLHISNLLFQSLPEKYQHSPEKLKFIEETTITAGIIELQQSLAEIRPVLESTLDSLAPDIAEWEGNSTLNDPQVFSKFPGNYSTILGKILAIIRKLEIEHIPLQNFIPLLVSEIEILDHAVERFPILKKFKIVVDCSIAVWNRNFEATLVRDGIEENNVDSVWAKLKHKAYSTIMHWTFELGKAVLLHYVFPFANIEEGLHLPNLFDGSHVSVTMSQRLTKDSISGFRKLLEKYRKSLVDKETTILGTHVQYENNTALLYTWSIKDYRTEIEALCSGPERRDYGGIFFSHVSNSSVSTQKHAIHLTEVYFELRAKSQQVDGRLQKHLKSWNYEWQWEIFNFGDSYYEVDGRKYLIDDGQIKRGEFYYDGQDKWTPDYMKVYPLSPYGTWRIELQTIKNYSRLQALLDKDISLEMYGSLMYLKPGDLGGLNLKKYYREI